MIILSCLLFLRIPKYINVTHILHYKVYTMPNTLFWGKGGIAICIPGFIYPRKMIREKYLNHPKSHKLYNLLLIVEYENMIQKISSVSDIYTFLHAFLRY